MNEDSNRLIEHYNVVKRACKMIHGDDSVKDGKHGSGGSSEEALNDFREGKFCFFVNITSAAHEAPTIRLANEGTGISLTYLAGTI
jgi:hypothetical protein